MDDYEIGIQHREHLEKLALQASDETFAATLQEVLPNAAAFFDIPSQQLSGKIEEALIKEVEKEWKS